MSLVRAIATPVPTHPTLQNVTYNDPGTQYRIIGQLADRSLLGYDQTNKVLVQSTNDGGAWATYCNFAWTDPAAVNGPSQCYLRPDGEIVIITNKASDNTIGASVWVSAGWANPATATFTKTLQLPNGLNFAYHGFSAHGNTIVCSEYGSTWSGAAPYSRYVYRSDDGGDTFATIFDFGTTVLAGDAGPVASVGKTVHLHGCCYDPWFERVWLLWGDAPASSHGGAYLDDDGDGQWHRIASAPELYDSAHGQWQCLAPIATEAGLLTLPDAAPTVVGRIGRKGYRQTSEYGPAHMLSPGGSSPQTTVAMRGNGWYRSPAPGAPLLATAIGTTSPSPGAMIVVQDSGRTIYTAFLDPAVVAGGANNTGLQAAYGPTNTGKFVIISGYTGRHANGDRIVGELLPN